MRKLKRTEARAYTLALLKEQGGICPLCQKPITVNRTGVTDYALDHWHFGEQAGQVRGVLHRHCNRSEAKVFQAVESWGTVGRDVQGVIEYLQRLIKYYQAEAKPVIYHLHKTEDEKREERNRKAREARARVKAKAAYIASKGKL